MFAHIWGVFLSLVYLNYFKLNELEKKRWSESADELLEFTSFDLLFVEYSSSW